MPMADRAGVFHAHPINLGVAETGPNELATVTIDFHLYEEKQPDGGFADVSDEMMQITGYFYLEKRDRSINEFVVDSLKAAFPDWDGRDPFWLQDQDWSDHAVQVTLGWETYEGQQRLKVQFLNPYGSEGGGGVKKSDDSQRRAILNRLGPKLRAMSGGQPANAPAAKGKPKPPAQAPKRKPPAANEVQTATRDEAWRVVTAAMPDDVGDGEAVELWNTAIAKTTGKADDDSMTPADWAKVVDGGPAVVQDNAAPF